METAKKRQAKATKDQIDHMVDYFVLNPHMATGKFSSLNAHSNLRGSWEELTSQLNSMFKKEGDMKDVKSWKSTWRDNKSAVATKVAKIKRLKRATGNFPIPSNLHLNERDLKIIDLVGMEYIEGDAGVPDSFPEEEEGATGICGTLEQQDVDCVVDTDDQQHLDCVIFEGTMDPTEQAPPTEQAHPEQGTSTAHPAITPERGSSARQKGRPERAGWQQESRSQFMAIAERQVACMEKLAESVEQQTQLMKDMWERSFNQQEQTNALLQMFIDMKSSK